MWMHYGYRTMGWGIPSLFWVIFIVLLAVFLIYLLSGSHEEDSSNKDEKETTRETEEDTAIAILRERYAKGEITKRQFQDMKKDLL